MRHKKSLARSARSRSQTRGGKPPKLYRPSNSVAFSAVRGKILTDIYLTMESDLNCLTLRFADNTELVVDIEPCLSFAADYVDWKTGNEHIIRRWLRARRT